MLTLARTAATPVWLLLIAATAVSLRLGAGHGFDSHALATVVVMTVAFIKVRFIGMYFMELRHAPFPLRLAFHAWYTVGCAVVLGIYLLS